MGKPEHACNVERQTNLASIPGKTSSVSRHSLTLGGKRYQQWPAIGGNRASVKVSQSYPGMVSIKGQPDLTGVRVEEQRISNLPEGLQTPYGSQHTSATFPLSEWQLRTTSKTPSFAAPPVPSPLAWYSRLLQSHLFRGRPLLRSLRNPCGRRRFLARVWRSERRCVPRPPFQGPPLNGCEP